MNVEPTAEQVLVAILDALDRNGVDHARWVARTALERLRNSVRENSGVISVKTRSSTTR